MAENPLLPHRKLQELYTLMERTRMLERKSTQPGPREAALAAAAIHLAPGDALLSSPGDRTALELAPLRRQEIAGAEPFTPQSPTLPLAAATARGLQLAAGNGVVLALASAHTAEPGWAETLTWAQAERLPLILLCLEPPPAARRTSKPTATAVNRKQAQRAGVPLLDVDGEDAVAVFRVMQESALRARSNFGPSVIWAMLGISQPGARTLAPLARLRRYMAARDIPLPR